MRKNIVLLMVALLTVVSMRPATILAQPDDCKNLDAKGKVKAVAKRAVKDPFDQEAWACYNTLDDANKAAVFEAIAEERGIPVEELRKEARDNAERRSEVVPSEDGHGHTHNSSVPTPAFASGNRIQPLTHAGSFWRQPIERIIGEHSWSLTYASSSYTDAACDDNDLSDVDYVFSFLFSSNVNNPDGLRSLSWSLTVDSMLVYYQYQYGGIDGRGYTDRPGVRVCLGDRGVANAGGEAHVRSWLGLWRW